MQSRSQGLLILTPHASSKVQGSTCLRSDLCIICSSFVYMDAAASEKSLHCTSALSLRTIHVCAGLPFFHAQSQSCRICTSFAHSYTVFASPKLAQDAAMKLRRHGSAKFGSNSSSTGRTVHTVGCTALRPATLAVSAEFRLCQRCVKGPPEPTHLLFLNKHDTYCLAHRDPGCVYIGNAGFDVATVCGICWRGWSADTLHQPACSMAATSASSAASPGAS